jgi:hypothetical protein
MGIMDEQVRGWPDLDFEPDEDCNEEARKAEETYWEDYYENHRP